MLDERQKVFETFEVPDPVRIRKAVGIIKNHFRNIEGINVLECGIAKGGVADTLKTEKANCYGVDANPREVPGIVFKQADLNVGIPDFGVSFDAIFAGEVMEHLFDDGKFLKECFTRLKPGGLLVVTVPNLFFSANRLVMFFGRMPFFACEEYHYHFYSRKTLTGLFRDAGFEVVGFSSSHVLFSSRRNPAGKIFEWLGDVFPSFGAHLIIAGRRPIDSSHG